eukprot:935063-Prymnesium_polylepis.1
MRKNQYFKDEATGDVHQYILFGNPSHRIAIASVRAPRPTCSHPRTLSRTYVKRAVHAKACLFVDVGCQMRTSKSWKEVLLLDRARAKA